MTILPPVKKKREREQISRPQSSASGSDVRQSSTNTSPVSANRKVRRSPRPHEKTAPPTKRAFLASPAAPHSSPISSPRGTKTNDENSTAGPSSSNNCNSDDEYEQCLARDDALEKEFSERLTARGLVIKEMKGDGACMFRAIAEQVYGDQEMHGQIRSLCMDYMMSNKDYFSDFITEEFDSYIRRKRDDTVHGNHVELQAISEMFARPVEIYQYSDEPINILLPRSTDEASSSTNQQNPPLRLSYHGLVHYNAIVDPNTATIGVGLGLPGLNAGSADVELMKTAIVDSEREHIEETMLKDKIDMTDWQRTQADLDEQIARESYMTFLRDMEKEKKEPETNKTLEESDKPSTSTTETTGLYEELLAAQSLATDWETYNEDVAMTEALILSQQEFIANQQHHQGGSESSSK